MTAAILFFGRGKAVPPLAAKMPWQNQDLAELYRVRDRLVASGLAVEVEAGVSDEGDPWFVYQQANTDNVVVHIARIDTQIHVINCITGGTYVGASFREVSDRMLDDAPLALGNELRRSSNVVLHPSAFLTAFVTAAIMLVDLIEHSRAEAAEIGPEHGGHHIDLPMHVDTVHHNAPTNVREGGGLAEEGNHSDNPSLTRRVQKDSGVWIGRRRERERHSDFYQSSSCRLQPR